MTEIITSSDAQYAFDIVETICSEVGPGLPGSYQEWLRAEILKKELESHLGSRNVVYEKFSVAPEAWLAAYPISAILMLAAALLNIFIGRFTGIAPWVTAVAALVFAILSPLLFIIQFVLNVELLDPFFRKKQSVNVVGRLIRPGTTNVKRLLILSGHHDSALENTWLRLTGYGFFALSATFLIGFITMLVLSILQLAGIVIDNENMVHTGTIGWAILLYPIMPAIIFALFFNRGRKKGGNVPGAVDNLAASALTVAMCRFLVNNPWYIPDNTEIRFISFGSEEAGLRGSRRYVERHLDELNRLDVRMLNFEMIANPEINILTSDANGFVKNSPEMVSSVNDAAERAGVPHKVMPGYFGVGTDASSFNRVGLKATTLLPFKSPQQLVAFYHQKWDSPEILRLEPLLNVLKLTFEWVRCGGT